MSFELVGAQAVGGGVPEVLGRERARQGGESDAGLLQVLGRARVGEPRLCTALATAAARWRPQSSLGRRGEGRRGTTRGEVGPEAARCHVRRRAKQEVACGLPRRRAAALSAGGAKAERVRGGRKSLDLFAKSKNFRGPTVNKK